MKTAILVPVKQRYLTPQEYLRDLEYNKTSNNIETVKFIPPQIGKGGFGKFLVKYKMPILVEQ